MTLPKFVCIHERLNTLTAQWVRLDPPVEVHREDLDWLQRLWEEGDLLDYELWRAGVS